MLINIQTSNFIYYLRSEPLVNNEICTQINLRNPDRGGEGVINLKETPLFRVPRAPAAHTARRQLAELARCLSQRALNTISNQAGASHGFIRPRWRGEEGG